MQSFSPHDPTVLVSSARASTPEQVTQVVEEARRRQAGWWAAGPAARSGALAAAAARLREHAGAAAELIELEVGKPIVEARAEVARAAAILDYYAQAAYFPMGQTLPTAAGLLFTDRRPRGVAGLITPWNFPIAIPVWKAAPAMACGNAVVLKSSPEAIGCAEFLLSMLQELPILSAPGEAETGRAIVERCDVVSFTGSAQVGRTVVVGAAGHGTPVQAEMGGQNAAVVLPDADIEATAAMLAGAMMSYAGQKCTATSRVIVVGDPAALTEALTAAVSGLELSPLISAQAAANVRLAARSARADGGRLLTKLETDGHRSSAVLIDRLRPDHPVAREETFGPIAVIQHADDLDTAIALVNSVRYGLVTSIHGRDAGHLLHAAQRVDTGLVRVNAPTTGVDFHAPFGGEKDSSYGHREQGLAALDFYSSSRTVTFGGA